MGALMVGLAPAAPVRGSTAGAIYDPCTGKVVGWECPPFRELVLELDAGTYAVDWWLPGRVAPATLIEVHGRLVAGLALLRRAHRDGTGRAEALAEFAFAASGLGPERMTFLDVYRVGGGEPVPVPVEAPLTQFGLDLADGVRLMHQPDPAGAAEVLDRAVRHLNRALGT